MSDAVRRWRWYERERRPLRRCAHRRSVLEHADGYRNPSRARRGLIGDFNPHHVDEVYAKGSRYGGRVLHGMLTGAIMGAPLGMYFHGTAIGFLEHNVRFTAPVRAGDTLTTTWTIAAKHDKPKQAGGIVELNGECRNQDGIVVAVAASKMLTGNTHGPAQRTSV